MIGGYEMTLKEYWRLSYLRYYQETKWMSLLNMMYEGTLDL